MCRRHISWKPDLETSPLCYLLSSKVVAIFCKWRRYLPSDTWKLYIILSLTICQLLQSGVIIRAIACVAGRIGGERLAVWRRSAGAAKSLGASQFEIFPRVTIPPATQAIRIITLSPVLHVQNISLSPTSLIFFFSIQSLNSMSPALWHFNNSPGVGSEGSEPPSTYRTKLLCQVSDMCPLRVERHMSVLRIS